MATAEISLPSSLGLLPEPERHPASFLTSAVINLAILGFFLVIGMTARNVIQQHRYEQTVLIVPTAPPPPVKLSVPKIHPPKPPEIKLDRPKIALPKIEPRPELKPIQMEAKVQMPAAAVHPAIVLAPQPKAALAAAAPAQVQQAKPVVGAVHLGETFGVTPNPNAVRPATVAAIGNPYGGMNGPATAPRGVVGSTGIGNGTVAGSNAPGGVSGGRVASAGIPGMVAAPAPLTQAAQRPATTSLQILSKPPVQYTAEARQLKIQGDVVLRVTFTAAGQVIVHGVVQGLGHGLDEEARRVAQQIQFRPATRNGQATDLTTNITITFQMA
ncbi:energy transducer TonB [Acidobacteria bacterium AB60]|nr:energy transducer TonB [Acidobacteria bacterium AB60]